MATADKLKKYVTDIANAIRAKEGSTEKIKPQDFVQRIENLKVGGGTSESNIEYLDVSGGDFAEQPASKSGLMRASSAIRIKGEGYLNILPSAYIMIYQEDISIADIKAFKIDMNEMYLETNAEPKTIKEELEKSYGKEYLASIPRLTKEQFYTLE